MTELKKLRYRGRPLFFITHGFMSGSIPSWAYEMKDALIGMGYNVVLVEWYSIWKTYSYAVADTRIVSDVLAVFIDELVRLDLVSSSQIVLVGFSLGAHISGMVAQKLGQAKIKAIIEAFYKKQTIVCVSCSNTYY
uniref:Lipase domain-containing protein n=1 Tax=Romanomermis culicivorax TaxID=13658 RepID=A0A915L205_ROMCU